jgi:hypothetical protein
MPKGPQGQKRPADAVARAVMVAQIATGEIEEEVAYATSEFKGSAGGKARAQHLSDVERTIIAKAGAKARWNNERSVDMPQRERLMAALFERPGIEHIDVKFFVGNVLDLSSEQFCSEAASLIDQMHAGERDEEFAEQF